MIKKFDQFIKEEHIKESIKDITVSNLGKNVIESILPRPDLEDQFLRLSEVFNCDIVYIYRDKITVCVFPKKEDVMENYGELMKEIHQVKNRMENMYPDINIKFTDGPQRNEGPASGGTPMDRKTFSISLKKRIS